MPNYSFLNTSSWISGDCVHGGSKYLSYLYRLHNAFKQNHLCALKTITKNYVVILLLLVHALKKTKNNTSVCFLLFFETRWNRLSSFTHLKIKTSNCLFEFLSAVALMSLWRSACPTHLHYLWNAYRERDVSTDEAKQPSESRHVGGVVLMLRGQKPRLTFHRHSRLLCMKRRMSRAK